jgi:NCS1 family nucleobase:cation symporter-1
MLAALALATLTTNVAANVVSPSYDFSNAWPKRISFRTGGIITGIIGVLIMPWQLLADPNQYIWTWLGTYGGATGPIAGVLIADYWWVRRKNLKLADLYRSDGVYGYAKGWNWIAVVSLLIGIFIAIGGAYSQTDLKPFPANGIIPFLKPFYDYSWAVGLAVAFVIYGGLTLTVGKKHVVAQTEA